MISFEQHEFRPPTRSNDDHNTTCVELACRGGVVELRDDKVEWGSPVDHRLRFTVEQFDAWQCGVRAGNVEGLCLTVTKREDGMYEFRSAVEGTSSPVLVFDQDEVEAFYYDVREGKYDARLGLAVA